jgi:hypothetical protein
LKRSADAFAQQLDPSQASQLPTQLGPVDASQRNVPADISQQADLSQQQTDTSQQQADTSQQAQDPQAAPAASGTVMDQLMG